MSSVMSQVLLLPDELKLELRYSWLECDNLNGKMATVLGELYIQEINRESNYFWVVFIVYIYLAKAFDPKFCDRRPLLSKKTYLFDDIDLK